MAILLFENLQQSKHKVAILFLENLQQTYDSQQIIYEHLQQT